MVLCFVAIPRQIRRRPCHTLTLFHKDEAEKEGDEALLLEKRSNLWGAFPYLTEQDRFDERRQSLATSRSL
jgi:hypothetical protein